MSLNFWVKMNKITELKGQIEICLKKYIEKCQNGSETFVSFGRIAFNNAI